MGKITLNNPEIFVNPDDPNDVLCRGKLEVQGRYHDSFFVVFYQLAYWVTKHSEYAGLVMHIVLKMNKYNIYKTSNRNIANKLKANENNICKKLNALKDFGLIMRFGKVIFFSPVYATKAGYYTHKMLMEKWYNARVDGKCPFSDNELKTSN